MATKRNFTVILHPDAKADWGKLLAGLPGKREDVISLLEVFFEDWIKHIFPQLEKAQGAQSWQCPFARAYSFVMKLRQEKNDVEVTILRIYPTSKNPNPKKT